MWNIYVRRYIKPTLLTGFQWRNGTTRSSWKTVLWKNRTTWSNGTTREFCSISVVTLLVTERCSIRQSNFNEWCILVPHPHCRSYFQSYPPVKYLAIFGQENRGFLTTVWLAVKFLTANHIGRSWCVTLLHWQYMTSLIVWKPRVWKGKYFYVLTGVWGTEDKVAWKDMNITDYQVFTHVLPNKSVESCLSKAISITFEVK